MLGLLAAGGGPRTGQNFQPRRGQCKVWGPRGNDGEGVGQPAGPQTPARTARPQRALGGGMGGGAVGAWGRSRGAVLLSGPEPAPEPAPLLAAGPRTESRRAARGQGGLLGGGAAAPHVKGPERAPEAAHAALRRSPAPAGGASRVAAAPRTFSERPATGSVEGSSRKEAHLPVTVTGEVDPERLVAPPPHRRDSPADRAGCAQTADTRLPKAGGWAAPPTPSGGEVGESRCRATTARVLRRQRGRGGGSPVSPVAALTPHLEVRASR